MKDYIDKSFMMNPLGEYFKWLRCKCTYQFKYWGNHLRIGYLTKLGNTTFGRYNTLGSNCVVLNCSLGDFSYINSFSFVLNTTMGRYCSVGPNVKIAPGKHPTSVFVSTHPVTFNNQANLVKNYCTEEKFKNYQPVTIGNDVWIGANAIIIDGIHIADGAIIAANSLVTRDVGPFEIVGGNPAKFIKKRFDDEQIRYLVDTEWWNQSEEWIQANISKFWDIENFVTPV
ncbi:CatB-related O-acetyltransferase [Mucilaginibacter sp. FT3.2]|uniref:CatB-related O-acetyltransferase n=1 Tax=Mucilaginibacter sp. FT3.2 TaxID=2723090 RepID=UPI001622C1CD|nr:acetyltransferase-like isoleucine patch superfamily enzyme [Mucilaginibacter sp. FT3.2]